MKKSFITHLVILIVTQFSVLIYSSLKANSSDKLKEVKKEIKVEKAVKVEKVEKVKKVEVKKSDVKKIEEAIPELKLSRSDELKKLRKQTENSTLDVLEAQLEKERLEDEKKRLNKLLNKPVGKNYADRLKKVRAEVGQSMQAVFVKKDLRRVYLALDIGYMDYPNGRNIKGLGNVGLSLGLNLTDSLAFEADVFGSRLKVFDTFFDYSGGFSQLNQLNIMGSLKYGLPLGKIHPYVGGTAGYVLRQHRNVAGGEYFTSASADIGVVGGINYLFSSRTSVGVNGRYLMNLYTGVDKYYEFADSSYKPLEKFHYYTVSFNLKGSF